MAQALLLRQPLPRRGRLFSSGVLHIHSLQRGGARAQGTLGPAFKQQVGQLVSREAMPGQGWGQELSIQQEERHARNPPGVWEAVGCSGLVGGHC